MHTQRLTYTRTETITVEVGYAVDPATKANAEFWANHGFCNSSPLGRPGSEPVVAHSTSEWRLAKSEPPCSSTETPRRRGRK